MSVLHCVSVWHCVVVIGVTLCCYVSVVCSSSAVLATTLFGWPITSFSHLVVVPCLTPPVPNVHRPEVSMMYMTVVVVVSSSPNQSPRCGVWRVDVWSGREEATSIRKWWWWWYGYGDGGTAMVMVVRLWWWWYGYGDGGTAMVMVVRLWWWWYGYGDGGTAMVMVVRLCRFSRTPCFTHTSPLE